MDPVEEAMTAAVDAWVASTLAGQRAQVEIVASEVKRLQDENAYLRQQVENARTTTTLLANRLRDLLKIVSRGAGL